MGVATAKNGKEFNSDDWQTYEKFWRWLNKKYDYKVDLAASPANHKCGIYFTENHSALENEWHIWGNAWCNPPYSKIGPWLERGNDELNRQDVGSDWLVTFLIKADATAQNYWAKEILDLNGVRPIHKVQFIRPRLPHVDPWGGVHKANRFGSVLVHMTWAWEKYFTNMHVEWLDWRNCEQTDRPR